MLHDVQNVLEAFVIRLEWSAVFDRESSVPSDEIYCVCIVVLCPRGFERQGFAA